MSLTRLGLRSLAAGTLIAAATFAGLAFTHRKAYVTWVEEAKKPETRAARVEKAVAMLREGKTR